MFAVHIVRQKEHFHLFAFVILVEEFAETPSEKRDQLRRFVARDSVKSSPDPQQITPTAQRRGFHFRRRFHEKWLQIACQLFQLVIDLDKPLGVFIP